MVAAEMLVSMSGLPDYSRNSLTAQKGSVLVGVEEVGS